MAALELGEELRRRNWWVHLFANEVKGELRSSLISSNVTPKDDLTNIDIFSFDIVLSQHHLLPRILLEALNKDNKKWLFFVFSHLSPYDLTKIPCSFFEKHFADLILANSSETAQTLKEYGPPFDQIGIFANPAPLEFSNDQTDPAEHLKARKS